jgi:hypothetical protein
MERHVRRSVTIAAILWLGVALATWLGLPDTF